MSEDKGYKLWMLYVYASTIDEGSGAGLIVVSPKGRPYEHALKFMFKTPNNEAEYEALLADMEIYSKLGEECLKAFSDSQLVVSQMKGEYEAHDPSMVAYLAKVKKKYTMFKKFKIEHVPWSKNRQANALSKLISSSPYGLVKVVD